MFDWYKLERPIPILAPMDGYTDSPYRQLVKEINPRIMVVTEFISADGLKFGGAKTLKLLKFHESEQPLIVQIFGKNPENFARAAQIIEKEGASGIDINMGCPARKVVGSGHGSSLIKTPCLAYEIVKATVAATTLPVSVKTRIGWGNGDGLIEFVKGLRDAGACLVTVHGRTVEQQHTGEADWEILAKLKKAMGPDFMIFGNGGVENVEDGIAKCKKAGLDGFMIGRATFGNPWVFSDKYKEFTYEEKLPMIIRHCELNCEFYGERIGMMLMRKHLASYVSGVPGAKEARGNLVRVETLNEARELLEGLVQ